MFTNLDKFGGLQLLVPIEPSVLIYIQVHWPYAQLDVLPFIWRFIGWPLKYKPVVHSAADMETSGQDTQEAQIDALNDFFEIYSFHFVGKRVTLSRVFVSRCYREITGLTVTSYWRIKEELACYLCYSASAFQNHFQGLILTSGAFELLQFTHIYRIITLEFHFNQNLVIAEHVRGPFQRSQQRGQPT